MQKNSATPIWFAGRYALTAAGIKPIKFSPTIRSKISRNAIDTSMDIFRIAPSIPKQLLNFLSLTARIQPKTVSITTATITTLMI